MQSDGGLVDYRKFSGLRAILSGPAGGVVGYARTSFDEKDPKPVIGFDMVRQLQRSLGFASRLTYYLLLRRVALQRMFHDLGAPTSILPTRLLLACT